jgi:hypothetical protein
MYMAYLECDREGLEQDGENARMAAENCWSDRVLWMEPQDAYPYPSPLQGSV